MARELAGTVSLPGDDGEIQTYRKGTKEGDLPASVRKQITNPSAWSGEEDGPAPRTADGGQPPAQPELKDAAKGKGEGK